jgi:hypothetical protein
MPPKRQSTIKNDAVSFIVYIIIIILLYYIIGILVSTIILTLTIPIFVPFRKWFFDDNVLNIIPYILWKVLYSTTVIVSVHSVFMIILILVIVIYVLWIILKKIPIFGQLIIGIFYFPFGAFEEHGIFGLIDNILGFISMYMPDYFLKGIASIYLELLKFAKNKIVDMILFANPDAEIQDQQMDQFIEFVQKKTIESFENKKKIKNKFFSDTTKSIEEKSLADFYKTMTPVTPDADDFDRFMTTMNNEITKVQNKIDNTPNNIKSDIAASTIDI